MKYADLMNMKHVFFCGLTEPEENTLRLYFRRSKEVPEPLVIGNMRVEDAKSIGIDEGLPVIQVEFQTYIGYSVRNESYTAWDHAEEFEGAVFRVYNKSKYLDFIKVGTLASEVYPGPFKHYGMTCLNHVVDVVSTSEPVVTEVAHVK